MVKRVLALGRKDITPFKVHLRISAMEALVKSLLALEIKAVHPLLVVMKAALVALITVAQGRKVVRVMVAALHRGRVVLTQEMLEAPVRLIITVEAPDHKDRVVLVLEVPVR